MTKKKYSFASNKTDIFVYCTHQSIRKTSHQYKYLSWSETRSRVTARVCARPPPPFDPTSSNTFVYLQNEKNHRFLFCFRCPICLPPDWESQTRGKTFWCPWKTCGRGATSGLAFNYPLNGRFLYILRFASVVYILIYRFHCMQCLYRVSIMHF